VPLTPEQNKKLDDDIFAALDANTPPLNKGERDAINASIAPIIDNYTTGGGEHPPDAGEWQSLKWPTQAEGYTRVETSFPAKFQVLVPADVGKGQGRVQVAPQAAYDTHNGRTLKVAETPDGAAMSQYSTAGPGKTPNVPYWTGQAAPAGYPSWKAGGSYYITVNSGVAKEDKGYVDLYWS